ncbi:S8 family serine peptidase [Candidatus Parcubacteria bacterium]|nr:S8 family serine peptidase [Candidatus Parcubacteria bacterium]
MKKTKIILGLLVVGVLAVSGIALAATNNQAGQRVYVLTENSVIKKMLGVRHEFSGGFSTEVSAKLKVLSALGLIDTEPVQLYHILGKPSCGNGIIEGGEKCGEPGLGECPEGFACEGCKCVGETTSPERSCYPGDQKPWGIVMINGGSGGINVKVAVLDTGVYRDHLDLKANIIDCKDTTKRGIKEGCADRNGHGTHVSGTIAAYGGSDGSGIYGVAPETKLMAIKVCGATGCWADDIAAGIDYVADNGANIISMSLGSDTQSDLIKAAIDRHPEVLFVAAAGNDGPADGSIDYPAANIKVIAVGSIDSGEKVAFSSSRGINDGDYIVEEREVEFGAPGVAVKSTWKDGCYKIIGGTSMATPHIAGLAAKLWDTDAATTRTNLQILAKLHDLHTTEDDTATGFGLPIAPLAP